MKFCATQVRLSLWKNKIGSHAEKLLRHPGQGYPLDKKIVTVIFRHAIFCLSQKIGEKNNSHFFLKYPHNCKLYTFFRSQHAVSKAIIADLKLISGIAAPYRSGLSSG
jgi:hypothetical protein